MKYLFFTHETFSPVWSVHRAFALSLLTWLICVLLGPFGTYIDMTLFQRMLFWGFDVVVLMPASLGLAFALLRVAPKLPIWAMIPLAALLLAYPAALYVRWLYEMFAFDGTSLGMGLERLGTEIFFVTATLLALYFLIWPATVAWIRQTPQTPEDTEQSAPRAPLFDRLPRELQGGVLISISMEDHYANVVTSHGSHLVLISLRDALSELDGIDGARVHRSHWAAKDHAVALERTGRKHSLRLTDKRSLPVSQTYLDAAKALIGDG